MAEERATKRFKDTNSSTYEGIIIGLWDYVSN